MDAGNEFTIKDFGMTIMKFVTVLVLTLNIGCSTTSAFLKVKAPATSGVNQNARYAVDNFNGRGGSHLTSSIEQQLIESGAVVVDRKKLGPIIREKLIGQKGKILPADYLLFGRTLQYDFNLKSKSEPVGCSSLVTGKKSYGNRLMHLGTGKIIADVRITDLKTGEVVHSEKFSGLSQRTSSINLCTHSLEDYHDKPEKDAVMGEAIKRLNSKLMAALRPHDTEVYIKLFNVDNDLLPEVERGHDLLKMGELAHAKEQYGKAATKLKDKDNETKAHTLYAYGIATGYSGKVAEGLRLIDEAYSLNPEKSYLHGRKMMAYYMGHPDK